MFKRFTPTFIKELDERMLVKHPVIWMSKIHYVIWHASLIWLASAVLGYLVPIDLTRRVEYELWYFLFTILSIVVLCFWIYHYLIFNNEKNYGNRRRSDEYLNFILVFFTVAFFLTSPCLFEISMDHRIDARYTDQEVLKDLDKLNELDPYMAHSGNSYFNWYDSTDNQQYCTLKKLGPYGGAYYIPYYMRYDSLKYPELRSESKLAKLYRPVHEKQELMKKVNEYIHTASKYGVRLERPASEIADEYLRLLAMDKVRVSDIYGHGNYQYELMTVMSNLCDAKFKTLFVFTSDYLWTIFYISMCITLFLLLFKMTYWQQYIIMIVVLLLYPLITFIFSQLLPYNGFVKGSGFFTASLIALIVFSGVTLFITNKEEKVFQPVYNIFNQIFYVTLIFSPMLILSFLNENTGLFHFTDYNYYSGNSEPVIVNAVTDQALQYNRIIDGYYYQYWRDQYELWMKIMKYLGITATIISLPFFKALFVKQISLPEDH